MILRTTTLLAATASIALLSAACGGSDKKDDMTPVETSAQAETRTVILANGGYNPNTLSVPVGTVVTFSNRDAVQHTVTMQGVDEIIAPGSSYVHTFSTPGTYTVTDRMASTPTTMTVTVM